MTGRHFSAFLSRTLQNNKLSETLSLQDRSFQSSYRRPRHILQRERKKYVVISSLKQHLVLKTSDKK